MSFSLKNDLIVFEPGSDGYVRKAVELAAADVVLREEEKTSGNVERLSITILKAVQDALFDMTRSNLIKQRSLILYTQYLEEYREIFIKHKTKYFINQNGKNSGNEVDSKSKAEKLWETDIKRFEAIAKKQAFRDQLLKEITEDDLVFWFDAKSIFKYAKITKAKQDKLFNDVQKVQTRNAKWSERYFNKETGTIEKMEYSLSLLPTAIYYHGANPKIQIRVNKDMAHLVLFVSSAYLRFHYDSYMKLHNPNAIKLYEVLVNIISGNHLFLPGSEGLTFDVLQRKFGTNYLDFKDFLSQVITKSLTSLNEELGTDIKWKVDKKEGRATKSIRFIYSRIDAKILIGEDDIAESDIYTFEFYLVLFALGGSRPQGGLGARLIDIRTKISYGEFDYYGKSKEDLFREYEENLLAAEELESIVNGNLALCERFVYDPTFLNVFDKDTLQYVGTTAIDTLCILKETQLIPIAKTQASLPFFDDYVDEAKKISQILPLRFKLTPRRIIEITKENFDSYRTSLEPCLSSTERFDFISESQKKQFCEMFNISYKPIDDVVSEAVIVETNSSSTISEFSQDDKDLLLKKLIESGVFTISKNKKGWEKALNDLAENFGTDVVFNTITFLCSGTEKAAFWLGLLATPGALKKHFEKISTTASVNFTTITRQLRNDPEVVGRINIMLRHEESEDAITEEVQRLINQKISSGKYGENTTSRRGRNNDMGSFVIKDEMHRAGFTNIFEWIESDEFK